MDLRQALLIVKQFSVFFSIQALAQKRTCNQATQETVETGGSQRLRRYSEQLLTR
jgi:hypothetical protein